MVGVLHDNIPYVFLNYDGIFHEQKLLCVGGGACWLRDWCEECDVWVMSSKHVNNQQRQSPALPTSGTWVMFLPGY